ncbi:MAG: PHP domain-containing protein [Clostridia bacterium]|nr:PHP domain-containing protein [Clostridia bacterium]
MILGDYHTHTVYSHGKGSVLENAIVAKEKGLKEIAITDHGFSHIAFNLKRSKLKDLRRDIDEAMEKTGVKIYLGVEANLMNYDGDVDITEEDLKTLEVVVMGFHKGIKNGIKSFFGFSMGNILADYFKCHSKKRIEKNTQSYIKAVEKYPIDIISHLNLTAKVDVKRVAEACARTNTHIELNGKRIHFNEEEVKAMLETDVKFVISSDAHTPDRVGDDTLGMQVATMYNIPLERIVNINDLIKIKSKG